MNVTSLEIIRQAIGLPLGPFAKNVYWNQVYNSTACVCAFVWIATISFFFHFSYRKRSESRIYNTAFYIHWMYTCKIIWNTYADISIRWRTFSFHFIVVGVFFVVVVATFAYMNKIFPRNWQMNCTLIHLHSRSLAPAHTYTHAHAVTNARRERQKCDEGHWTKWQREGNNSNNISTSTSRPTKNLIKYRLYIQNKCVRVYKSTYTDTLANLRRWMIRLT